MEQANQLEPPGVAGPLLEVASPLDANGIPARVFTAPAITDLLTTMVGREVGDDQARDGLGRLHRLSLITLDPSAASQTVQMHALVQRATRDGMPVGRLPVVARAAADALYHGWPEVERDTAVSQVLRAIADALCGYWALTTPSE